MYCSECGATNRTDAIFCQECGKKINRKKRNFKIKLQKKTKILIVLITLFIIMFGSASAVLLYMTSPKTIAKQYMEAIVKKDSDKLYQFLDLSKDKTFVTKELYQTFFNEEYAESIENYQITDVYYGNGRLTATITFTYTEISGSEKTMKVSLLKQKKKKLLFFDDWKIAPSVVENQVIEDYKIIVPKKAKVTYAGILVKDRYLKQEDSTETTDIYQLEQVFSFPTQIKVTLENGYEIEDIVIPSTYKNSYTAKVSLSTLSKEEQEKFMQTIQADLTTLYEGAIKETPFVQLKLKIDSDQKKEIENEYRQLTQSLKSAYNTLQTIKFTNISISSVKMTETGSLKFRFKANYQYSIRYLDTTLKEQTKSLNSYSYMELSYVVKKGEYYIVDANDLEDYFSRY